MAYKIGDGCIGCCTCLEGCPVGAISEDGGVCVINPDMCIECGACAASCPMGVIDQE